MAEQTSGSSDEPSDSPLAAGWGLWLRWVLASTVGWAVSGLATGVGSYRESVPTIIVAGYVGVAVGGIVTGVLQWLVLRRQVARAGRWVLASIVAVAVVGVVVFGVGVVNVDVGWVVGVGAFGTVVGVLQWLVLRRQVPRAGWWVLASTVGWVVGGPMGGFVGWAVYGALTGTGLVWLLRQRPPGSAAPFRPRPKWRNWSPRSAKGRRQSLRAQRQLAMQGPVGSARSLWQPLGSEEGHDRHLSNHEKLKDMGSCPLVGLMDNAENGSVTQHEGEGGERHCQCNKSARLLHR